MCHLFEYPSKCKTLKMKIKLCICSTLNEAQTQQAHSKMKNYMKWKKQTKLIVFFLVFKQKKSLH